MDAIQIGTRREVLWDDFLMDTEKSTAQKLVHSPVRRELVLECGDEWEGDGTDYFNAFQDADGTWRMYYLGWHMKTLNGKENADTVIRVCYAEGKDGVHWTKPDLGICQWNGSKHNNIILDENTNTFDNFMVMRDPNEPEGSPALYKGIGSCHETLWCFPSPDAIHFTKGWQITDKGIFDTLNIVFWDPDSKQYFIYLRGWHTPDGDGYYEGIRDIRVMTSPDFRVWSDPRRLDFGSGDDYPLYTNQVCKYPRAEHMFVGFPTRYVERPGWNDSFERLTGREKRLERMQVHPRYGLAITDCVFMCSRDGFHWDRCDDAFIRPGPEEPHNWLYGDGYPAYGIVETPGVYPGTENELSLFLPTGHWMGGVTQLWRWTLRLDGYVSRHAGYVPKTVVTKPFVYDGTALRMNFSTSAIGSIRVTLRGEDGTEVESGEVFGDSTDREIPLSGGGAAALRGKPVTMTVTLKDADVYAFRFA